MTKKNQHQHFYLKFWFFLSQFTLSRVLESLDQHTLLSTSSTFIWRPTRERTHVEYFSICFNNESQGFFTLKKTNRRFQVRWQRSSRCCDTASLESRRMILLLLVCNYQEIMCFLGGNVLITVITNLFPMTLGTKKTSILCQKIILQGDLPHTVLKRDMNILY